MAERQWYWTSEGRQEGPVGEAAFQELVADGRIGRDTLVWHAGLPDWRRAGEVADIAWTAPPPLPPGSGGLPAPAASGPFGEAIGVWGLFGRGILFYLGVVLVIPAPWVANALLHFLVARIRVPGRPNLVFTGRPEDIWYVWMVYAACTYLSFAHNGLALAGMLVQVVLAWVILRWIVSHLASEGTPLPLRFGGSIWGYVGWTLLYLVSILSIIGWAWVITAFARWICRHIEGTTRGVTFIASGWQVLWRTIVFVLSCMVLIPIPWTTRWLVGWYVRQFVVGRPADA